MPNFYDVLGVSKESDDGEIKKAFRKLSLQHHPDRNQGEDTTEKFQEINEAFETLSDPEKRQQYNMELQFGAGGGNPFGGGEPDMNDIFNMMFGGGGGGGFPGMGGFPGGGGFPGVRIFHQGGPGINVQTQMFHSFGRPEPIQTTVEITLNQSYQGCTVPVEFERWNIINNVRSTEREVLNVNLPRGIDDGETIVIGDRGNNINNQARGEVRINIRIKNDSEFVRRGMDIYLTKKITLKDSLCGFTCEFDHLNGKRICMNNSTGNTVIKPNSKKVINGLGMVRENNTGNFIIEFDVQFPDTLTEEQRDLLRKKL
jgi:DnaJ-class molecular chaperone